MHSRGGTACTWRPQGLLLECTRGACRHQALFLLCTDLLEGSHYALLAVQQHFALVRRDIDIVAARDKKQVVRSPAIRALCNVSAWD